jgi:hypothetical protein
MLQTIMDANPQAMMPLEARIILFLKKKYFGRKDWSPGLVREFVHDLYKEKKFERFWRIKKEELLKNLLQYPAEQLDFALLCKLVYLNYHSPFGKEKIKVLGDKNPLYSVFIDDLLEVFPEARFIHLVRDHRDNIVSNQRVFIKQSTAYLAEGWKRYNQEIERVKKQHPEKFYTVRYEDLVSQPERYVKELCAFAGMDFYPAMLDSYKKVNEIYEKTGSKSIAHLFANMMQPVNTSRLDKWKEIMTREEIEIADHIAGNVAATYGYSSASAQKRISLKAKAWFGKFRYWWNLFVISSYYHSPFWMRDTASVMSYKLFKWFGFSHHFNHDDYDPNLAG